MDYRPAEGSEPIAPSASNAYRERCDAAFRFQGAMSVALASIKRIAETGRAYDFQPVLTPETRCELIAKDCERLLAMLPADLREVAAKL